jgi:5-methylcytosine-specific restriction protein A
VNSPARYCVLHVEENTITRQRREFDRKRAGDEHRKLYGTARWKRLRMMKLQANPFCEIGIICDPQPKTGIRARATDVHHLQGIVEQPELAFEWSNLQSACHACHAHVTALTEGFAKPRQEAA